MKKKKILETVKINNYLDLVFEDNNVFLQVGGYGLGLLLKININDFWIQIREFYEEKYLKRVGNQESNPKTIDK